MIDSKLRVLWFCNCPVSAVDSGTTGTWLSAMALGLAESHEVELGIIAPGAVGRTTRADYGSIAQWIVPAAARPGFNGLPANAVVREVQAACEEFAPDLVQVWGTENYWGLLTARHLVNQPALLTIQGVKYRIADVFDAGMTAREQWRAVGLKEALRRSSIGRIKRSFRAWGRFEKEMIAAHRAIECQTPWQAAQARSVNGAAPIELMDLPLRQAFDEQPAWQPRGDAPRIFCSASYASPFKGLHVAIRAVALLKRSHPQVQLRIAGSLPLYGIRRDGYLRWVADLANSLGIADNVRWLGPLAARHVALELSLASATVIPTFIESYSMTLAESMRIGTPTVVSYTGGTSFLGEDEETCLFFPPGDVAMCADQLLRVLTDSDFACRVSARARAKAAGRHDRAKLVRRQLEIYRKAVAT